MTPPSLPPDEIIRARIAAYSRGLREGRQITARTQTHTDVTITWALGLMAAGIFLSPDLWKLLCGDVHRSLVIVAFVPWLVGVLIALVAKVVVKEWSDTDDDFVFEKAHRLDELLLTTEQGDRRACALREDRSRGLAPHQVTDRRRALLTAALGFLQLPMQTQPLAALHSWLDSWTGIGMIVVGIGAAGAPSVAAEYRGRVDRAVHQ